MTRRRLLKTGIGGAAGLAALPQSCDDRVNIAEKGTESIRALFHGKDPEVIRLTEEVYQKCILGKVFPAEAPLEHNWIAPGGGYRGQWIWDTMFVVDLLSVLPGKDKVIRDVFQNYWDFQLRWNERMPDCAHDMIACMIEPGRKDWVEFPAYSQIPILAWGVERTYKRTGDNELLKQCLEPLERFHEWYWRERDVTDIGLVAVGAYSGDTQHARFETFDYECNMDDLKMTTHPTRKGEKEGAWYGDICVTGNTSYLILGEKSLMRLAEVAGDEKMRARRRARIDKAVEAMRKHMWDEEAGAFLSVKRDTLERIPVATIGSWIPLAAGVPTESMAARMAEVLRSPSWQTPLPVPTVDRRDSRWKSDGFWRGDVWPPTNYQIAGGLASYGHRDLAADIADKTIANAMNNGINERYDSVSGKPLGVECLGMTCTILTMMLDGLSRSYRLKVRNAP
jgi:putative isomerase